MFFIEGHCPHCDEKRGFNIFACAEYISTLPSKILKSGYAMTRKIPNSASSFYASGICIHCGNPVIIGLEVKDINLMDLRDCVENPERKYQGHTPMVTSITPKPIPPYRHSSFPENVASLFVDLQKMLSQNLAPSLIINGCRNVLEASVNDLGGKGEKLWQRIEDLKNKSIVNGVLFDWATHIRLEGNEASHEITGTSEEAEELVEFTKLFLQYTFEFPARIKELRGEEGGTKTISTSG